ncbi:MAG: phosphomannomutase/phosphoglucomutase [Archangium sp.]|nr:phosphomannomutase/phosphoglucomutase [Archangium sp.]MBM4777048.1 phosphomannomutase/phosphoglucomutase [Archangiaceae bacterium]
MNPQIFREYDVRGLVDKDLTDAVVEDLGRGLATMVKRAHGSTIVVGRDARESGPRFQAAFIKGATSTGIHVIDVGVVPTPVVYFAANTLPVDGLAVITGSHNPPEYNGFKMGVGKTTFYGETIQQLRTLIETRDFEKGTPGTVTSFDACTPYLHFVTSTVTRGPKKLKVVVDAGNGVGGIVSVPMLQKLGYDVVPLYCEPDGRFPNHHADPTVAKNLELLIAAVKKEKADLGVAYDGDADRIGVVDEHGEIIWGDKLMILLSRAVLKAVPGAPIVGEVKCSFTMYDDIAKHGGKPVMWKTGHSLIKAKMKELHAELAGEMSGHIFYKHRFFGFDDAPYTAARLLEILSNEKGTLSSMLADVPVTYSSPELRFDTVEEKKTALVKRCTEMLRAKGLNLIEVDGVRVTWPDGWGLIRSSNTTPILVVRYEAKTKERLEEIRALIDGTIAAAKKEIGG